MANELERIDLTRELAGEYSLPPSEFLKTIKAVCFPDGAASDAQLVVFLTHAKHYGLNPLAREIYAFVKGGRLSIGVQVDGWIRKAQEHPQFAGFKFEDRKTPDGKIDAVTCIMYRKDWSHPGEYTAYIAEWGRTTDVWKSMPRHQLAVKAFNQCCRFTLGMTGIYDPDDLERIAAGASDGAVETTSRVVVHPDAPSANGKPPETPESDQPEDAIVVRVCGRCEGALGENAVSNPFDLGSDTVWCVGCFDKEKAARESAGAQAAPPTQDASPTSATAESAAPAAETETKRGRPKSIKSKLKELAKDLPQARITVLLGQFGVTKLDEMTDEQAASAVARLEARGKK